MKTKTNKEEEGTRAGHSFMFFFVFLFLLHLPNGLEPIQPIEYSLSFR